jgi:hypothetical protein
MKSLTDAFHVGKQIIDLLTEIRDALHRQNKYYTQREDERKTHGGQ